MATGREALELCYHELPALAIIDIRLRGELDGIDLGNQLGLLGKVPLVFISSDNNGAALHRMAMLQPLAFLPKPYQPKVLQQIISQVLSPVVAYPGNPPVDLTAYYAGADLFVRESSALVRLDTASIMCVQAVQQHAVLMLESGRRHSVRLTLAEVLAQLPAADFVQCHRAWIINLRYIEQIELSANLVHLTTGVEAIIGRAYRQNIQQRLRILG